MLCIMDLSCSDSSLLVPSFLQELKLSISTTRRRNTPYGFPLKRINLFSRKPKMVQRKVQKKVGIKPNPIKANNQIVNHKPFVPSQNHDIKNNKGADLKKKMMKKKSGKTNFTRHLPQPGKPPPKKQQQQPTPNYMKSTSSSVARKEQSQVSSRSLQTYPNSNRSKLCSANSVNKPTRSLARNSSLKLVRTTLTKTPSFKPVRATCSSTLKEAKFPIYLQLSPGGTESDGTSVSKVCPYTYCSLNGHHHPPLPPLKCFLSARRRGLKTQTHFKLGCLSPRRANPHGLGLSNVPTKIACTTEVAPLANEDDREFFVEIYSSEKAEMADPIGPNTKPVDDYNTTDSANVVDQKTEAISAEINIPGFSPAENLNEEILMPLMVQEEGYFGPLSMHTELGMEDSEASDMDWDVEKYYAYSEGEMDSIRNDTEPITLVDGSVVSKEITEKSADNILEETLDKESIISGAYYDYDESQSAFSDAEFDIDECVEATGDTSNNSLDVAFILDGEVAEKSEDERGFRLPDSETARMDNQAVVMEDEISVSHEECITNQGYEEMALIGYQELNVCNFNEAQDETCKDKEESSNGNIVVKIEDAETKTDCCEEGYENGHGLKSKTKEDHTSDQAGHVTENASGVEGNQTAEACAEKVDQIKDKNIYVKYDASGEELSESYTNLRGIARRKDVKETEESREFNPRPPNFLPLEPDPEAEKVDLKHQMMDDRKNAEDWMLDFALRRAVDKLAPARKRKVALLVEAFETVLPTSKWEPHLRRSAAGFAHPRPIQACR